MVKNDNHPQQPEYVKGKLYRIYQGGDLYANPEGLMGDTEATAIDYIPSASLVVFLEERKHRHLRPAWRICKIIYKDMVGWTVDQLIEVTDFANDQTNAQ